MKGFALKYRAEIDGLRAIAVIPVILFHAGFLLFEGGFVGVDIFFVISGYLITSILLEDINNENFFVNFYCRRARRILPALFVLVLFCVPVAWILLLPDDLLSFMNSVVGVATFSSNILFWSESGYFDQAAELKPLLHTWSLAVEEQYYFLFPVFLYGFWRFGRNRVFWLIVIFAIISLALSEWAWRNKPNANFFLAPTRAWELLAGSIAAFIVQKRGIVPNNTLAILGFSAIIFSIFAYDKTTPFPSIYALVPTMGVVLIILFADENTHVAKILNSRLLVGIGLISYSAYLWHQPLFVFTRMLTFSDPSMALMIGVIILTLILAYLSWRFVEMPFRDIKLIDTKTLFLCTLPVSAFLIGLGGCYHMNIIPHKTVNISWLPENTQVPEKFGGIIQDGWGCSARDPFSSCVIGNTNAQNAIVIAGDSHARVLTEAAQFYSADKDFKLIDLTAGGCPFFLDLNVYVNGYLSKHCEASLQTSRMEFLKQLPASIVLLHARYPLYIIGDGFDNLIGGKEPSRSYYSAKHQTDDHELRYAQIEDAFEQTVGKLLEYGHKVVIVGTVPSNGWNPIHRLLKVEQTSINIKPQDVWNLMKIPLATIKDRNQLAEQAIERIKIKYPDVGYINPQDIFCDDSYCNSITATQILYSDGDHLSFEGTKLLFQSILEYLENQFEFRF